MNTSTGYGLYGNGAAAHMHSCNYQQWALEKKASGSYRIKQSSTLKCLDVNGNGVRMNPATTAATKSSR
ncbi:RICIN domain-containing protein [Streptomyces sp. NBC_01351]|uniref:RICIN domain-containing protein n=1 Tax=Streptomyces sp. NBC_01351 TaxID=2903833 RepID=UPI002E346757|nr:RICIN domain-containing protein [Streptomyces sp. NBC_01351]